LSSAELYRKYLNDLGGIILDAAVTVHRELGPGLLESVYELALTKELRSRNLSIKTQFAVDVFYKDESLGKTFIIDILVENNIVIEVKAVDLLHPVYRAQLITYLKLSKKKLGYLINFNVPLLKEGFNRIVYQF
jgi:GxxExxY protein